MRPGCRWVAITVDPARLRSRNQLVLAVLTRHHAYMPVVYEWRGSFANAEVEALHGEGFDHDPVLKFEWQAQLDRHSLGWVCARQDRRLVGFVNVAWDGSSHAFILDTVVVRTRQHGGVGTELVAVAAREATAAGCEWLHVDFEDHLSRFYFDSCGFRPTNAGLLRLRGE